MSTLILFRTLAVATFCLAYTLSFLLPKWTSYENGPIEMLQNFALVLGGLQAICYALPTRRPWGYMWGAMAPVWVICLGRELSWGAVFLPPALVTELGPYYTSSSLPYKFLVAPAVSALALLSIFVVLRFKVWTVFNDIWKSRQVPFFEIGIAGVALFLMTAAEHNMGLSLQYYIGFGQIFEETVELSAYLFLLSAQQRVRLAQIN